LKISLSIGIVDELESEAKGFAHEAKISNQRQSLNRKSNRDAIGRKTIYAVRPVR